MRFDDNTWQCMKKVSSQIEGLICSLIVYLENTGSEVESYHYEVFNKLWNEFRELEIAAVEDVRKQFYDMRRVIEEMAEKMKISAMSKGDLRRELDDAENVYDRLVVHSHNIRKFVTDTENPYIPDANDEIYSIFSDYKVFIESYTIDTNEKNKDPVCELIISFYECVTSIFEGLFEQYDRLLSEIGVDIQQRRDRAFLAEEKQAVEIIKKIETAIKITTSAVELISVTGAVMMGVPKKTPLDVVKKAINLCATIEESLDEINPDRKSFAREAIKRMGMDDIYKKVKSSILLEAAKNIAPMGKTTMEFVEGFRSGKKVRSVLRYIPDILNKGLGAYRAIISKYYENDINNGPKKTCEVIRKQAKQLKEYNEERVKYIAAKLTNRFPRKIKKPPLVPLVVAEVGTGIVSFLIEKGIGLYEKYVE